MFTYIPHTIHFKSEKKLIHKSCNFILRAKLPTFKGETKQLNVYLKTDCRLCSTDSKIDLVHAPNQKK